MSLLAAHRLLVLPDQSESGSVVAVGGFPAFEILTALAVAGAMPRSLLCGIVDPNDATVTATIQADLVTAMRTMPRDRFSLSSLIDVVRLLTPETALAVFGSERPTHSCISKMCGVDLRRYEKTRQLTHGADSDILARVLIDA